MVFIIFYFNSERNTANYTIQNPAAEICSNYTTGIQITTVKICSNYTIQIITVQICSNYTIQIQQPKYVSTSLYTDPDSQNM